MKSEHINPFIVATTDTFQTMCGIAPTRSGNLQLSKGLNLTHDFVAVLGLSGDLRGAVIMSMPYDTSKKIVAKFVGMDDMTEADVIDGFGELLNIIAGAAAARIEGKKLKLSLPTVIVGQNQQVHPWKDRPWVVIPMTLPGFSEFNILVAMEES